MASIGTSVSAYVRAAYSRGERGRTNQVKGDGRRGLLLSAVVAATQVNDSRTELLQKYLKKSQENKEKNDKERLDSYYKRNYKDYFGVLEGSLRQKKELTESEKGILEWLEQNKLALRHLDRQEEEHTAEIQESAFNSHVSDNFTFSLYYISMHVLCNLLRIKRNTSNIFFFLFFPASSLQ